MEAFYDTIKGGDYRSREANVHRLAEVSVNIIDQCVAQGFHLPVIMAVYWIIDLLVELRFLELSTLEVRLVKFCYWVPIRHYQGDKSWSGKNVFTKRDA